MTRSICCALAVAGIALACPLTCTPALAASKVAKKEAAPAARLGAVLALAIPLLTAVGWSLYRPPDVLSLLRRCAFALLAFLTVSVFYSPQWWQWLAVLLVPLCVRHRWLVWAVVFLDLWTYLHFPLILDSVTHYNQAAGGESEPLAPLRIVHVWVRAVGWLVLTGGLVWQERRATTSAVERR